MAASTISSTSQISKLIGPAQDYDSDRTAEKLKEARRLGMKVCGFFCRREDQSLPIEQGKFWSSADREVRGIIPPTRIHVWKDLTNEKDLEKFYGLYDEIVIDQDSVKYIGTDFISRFVPLFFPSSEAVFVFENTFFTSYPKELESPIVTHLEIKYPPKYKADEIAQKKNWFNENYPKGSTQYTQEFNIYKETIKKIAEQLNWSEEKQHSGFPAWFIQFKFPKEENPHYPFVCEATEKRKKHLEEYFQTVTCYENQPYPYIGVPGAKDCYFIARGIR